MAGSPSAKNGKGHLFMENNNDDEDEGMTTTSLEFLSQSGTADGDSDR